MTFFFPSRTVPFSISGKLNNPPSWAGATEKVEGPTPGPLPRCSVSILAVGTKHSRAPPGLANGASALQRAGRGWHLENTPGPWAPPWDGERQSEPASRAVSLPALHWTVEAQGLQSAPSAKRKLPCPPAHQLYFWADWTQSPGWDPEAVGPAGPQV